MKKINPAETNQPADNPAQSASESHGAIKGRQLTDRTMPQNDIPRGAEGGAGRGGAGAQQGS